MKRLPIRWLLWAAPILGLLTTYLIGSDNEITIREEWDKMFGRPFVPVVDHISWVPLVALLWHLALLFALPLIAVVLIWRRDAWLTCLSAVLLSLLFMGFPNRWYPPPLKPGFLTDLRWAMGR